MNSNDIDLAVLNELPEDIKKEIMETYKLDSRASTPRSFDENSTSTNTEKIKNVNLTVSSSCSIGSSVYNEAPPESKSAFHRLNSDQVKEALRTWLSSENEPKQFDISMLADYFKELALNRKIEFLQVIFNFLHR